MKVSKKLLGVLLGFVIIFGVGAAFAFSDTDSGFHWKNHKVSGEHYKTGFMSELTEEQMITLVETKMELKEQGASREEMGDAMNMLYDEWGIEFSDWRVKSKLGFNKDHHTKERSFGEGFSFHGMHAK